MSHFVAIVIGEDHDHELAPFHEFECTGHDDEFVEDIDETEEARSEYEERKEDPDYPSFTAFVKSWYGRSPVAFGETPNLESMHKYGYFLVDEQGEVTKVIIRTNPDSKWDWYVVGGRWGGYFLLKDGSRRDVATKDQIDFDGMRKAADDSTRESYITTGYDPEASTSWLSWEDFLGDKSFANHDDRREAYHDQPGLMAVVEAFKANSTDGNHDHLWFDFDTLLGKTADEYVEAYSNRGITPYAMVKDRQWQAKGEMGWFGMSSGDMAQADWNQQVWEAIQALPGDAVLTAVDCHI